MKQDGKAPSAQLKRDLALAVGALGVVFGDIGTSPLYAMRESALAAGGAPPGRRPSMARCR